MPELPEVETVRQGLNQVTPGQIIRGGDVWLDRTIAYPVSAADFLAGLKEKAIVQWHRRGKYLLAELGVGDRGSAIGNRKSEEGEQLSPDLPSVLSRALSPQYPTAGWLGVHLRMTGQLLWQHQDEPLSKHCRVRLLFPEGRELRFVDQRTFGQMWYVPPDQQPATVIKALAELGVEPLSPEFSVDYLADQLRDRKRPIKNALLDQRLIAGIGNIYADESLFLSHIKPETLCASLTPQQIEKLHGAIVHVLQTAVNARGTTFSDYRDIQGVNGNYGGIAWVYDRKGEPCRECGTPIERMKLAGRSAHFCPNCQS